MHKCEYKSLPIYSLKKFTLILPLIVSIYSVTAQRIQYRDKSKPAEKVVLTEDSGKAFKIPPVTIDPPQKKPYVEEQNMCNLTSRPGVASQLPLIINKISPEMVKMLKERYTGRLYSITGLNMIDQRLKFKLKICDKDNGKFRSEYLIKMVT